VFIDGKDLTVQDKNMQKVLIDKATYRRWGGYGTFYGITRYSFVCLSQNNDFTKGVLPLPHIKTMYFQMITLLLTQRASILRFSDEITAISDVQNREDNPSVEHISILYKNYLRFVNKLYFKEITAQDQGIELYEMAQGIMNIKRDIEDLRQEIGTLNGYAFLEQEREEKEEMNKITKLATIFLPATLIAGIFGMNIFPENFIDNIGGWILAFSGMIGATWWIAKVNHINILEYLRNKGKK
ncbi:MAG: CorA family divalent cation transporter, partial [Campylobacterota bacterium]|nr:CorA family divalent cation transporter [Campylobacterota bacterium]